MLHTFPAASSTAWTKAASILHAGGILIYPTETFYAIGCAVSRIDAVQAIYSLKARPANKPMPLIAADIDQVALVARIDRELRELLASFWPGPLTLVLDAACQLPAPLLNPAGKTAIRISSNPVAAKLAYECGLPLVATSANMSGQPAALFSSELDKTLLSALAATHLPCAILADDDRPATLSKPSTILEPIFLANGKRAFRLLREGAIDKNFLKSENLTVLD